MRTPLHATHLKMGAKVVDFHGWDMPIQYTSIIDEHAAARSTAGLFDLSHMGRVWVSGPQRKAYLQKLVTIDIEKMGPGRCRYTFLLTEKGTVIDDLLVYEDAKNDRSLLVVNASNREKDLEWMRKVAQGFKVTIDDVTQAVSLVAVQGPKCVEIVKRSFDIDPSKLKYYTFDYFPVFGQKDAFVSRTGYTGEDGFEIFVKSENAVKAWEAALKGGAPSGLKPVGLGARDTLRTEAGMPLYGQELDDQTTPVEAGLDFALALDKADFIGRPVLKSQAEKGTAKKLVGFHMAGSRIPRHGMEAHAGGARTGIVTSGTFSPTLQKPIGMAYVAPAHAAEGAELEIDIRGKREKAVVVKMPFYKRAK